jgi:hypothetical protein
MGADYPIDIWINNERYEKLRHAGLSDAAEDVLAGMRVVRVYCTEAQMNTFLWRYPSAKYDSATTKSIELLPPEVKDRLFELIVEKGSTDVATAFLANS